MRLIERNLNKMALSIEGNSTRDMKGIPHHAQHTKMLEFGSARSQAITDPTDQVVSQLAQQKEHFLGVERFFVAFGDAQTLLRAFDSGLHTAAAQVKSVSSQPDGVR